MKNEINSEVVEKIKEEISDGIKKTTFTWPFGSIHCDNYASQTIFDKVLAIESHNPGKKVVKFGIKLTTDHKFGLKDSYFEAKISLKALGDAEFQKKYR